MVRDLLPRKRFTREDLLEWLQETQLRNERARRSHAKRRARQQCTMATSIPSL
jgi:hypothetical protein